jgi:HNH endonuclease/AP2 domain
MESETLTQKRLKQLFVYDEKTGVFTRRLAVGRHGCHAVGVAAGTRQNRGYIVVSIDKRRYVAHRLAWMYKYGVWPAADLDHINEDKSDNRIINLRLATRAQNMQNVARHKHNTSGHKGVSWLKSHAKWRAYIFNEYKQTHLGLYATFEEAVNARLKAEQEHHTHRKG